MKLTASKILRTSYTGICLATLIFSGQTHATAYVYPGATAPLALSDGDSLTVNSGTMETPSGNATSYTVDFSNATATGITITVNSGATLTYDGTNGAAAVINSARSSVVTVTNTITNNGTINSGTGLYAISLNNSNGGTPHDTYNITSTGAITGAILTNGVSAATLTLSGSSANVTGTIILGVHTAGTSTLNIENGANFAPIDQITDINLVHVLTGSTLTFNTFNTGIQALTVDSGGTVNVNYALVGTSASDGAITNNGTINITADIDKTGTFSGTGTNVVSEALTVTTSNYTITNHTAVLQDVSDIGDMTLTNATFAATNFGVTYTGGYLTGQTYILVSAPAITTPAFEAVPTSTLFLTFSPPTVNGNTIQMLVTRTPFNTYATEPLTQEIGSTLETIGNNSPSSSMLTLLNAIEADTTANEVEYSLRQLAPLSSAPLYCFEIQDTTMYQVELRLASLHDQTSYIAGDIAKDNHLWVRPFGTYGNQKPKDDSLGYYGSSGGFTAGFDRNLGDNYTVGASGGYVLSHVRDKINSQSSTQIKSYMAMIYGSYDFTETRWLDWILAIIDNEFTAQRMININSFVQTATSSYSSQQLSVKGLWGKDYSAFDFMQLTPLGSIQYTFAKQYSYTENGAGAANLVINRTNSNVLQLAVGAKAAVPVWLNPSIVIPEIHAGLFYNPIVGLQNTVFNFEAGGGQTTSFFTLSRTGVIYGAALTIAVVDKLEVKANFDIDIEDRFSGYTMYLNLRYFL